MSADVILIGYDKSEVDIPTLTVGRKVPGKDEFDILNLFRGDEAEELYKKLITQEGK